MYLKAAVFFSLLVSSLAAPTVDGSRRVKRGVLTTQNYSQFQVSGGVAGNALAEVNAKFPVRTAPVFPPRLAVIPLTTSQIDQAKLASVDAQDLAILKAARVTAEAAETDAGGFNDAIKAAGGTGTAAGKALQNGKIKNKVLKLQLEVLALQIEAAQGKGDAAQLAVEQKKLNNNIKLDKTAAGQASTSVSFKGTDKP